MVTYSHHGRTSASNIAADLVVLYAVVYAEPPYLEGAEQVERFRASFGEEVARTGFSMITAHDAGKLIGAAYGWTMPAGSWWSRADKEAPSEIRETDKFAVMEWMVHPERRAEKIGARLIRNLLQDRQEVWATLASDPRSAARSMYERAGWRQVGHSELPWGPKMDILVFALTQR